MIERETALEISNKDESGYNPLRNDSNYILEIIDVLIRYEASLGETDIAINLKKFPIQPPPLNNMFVWHKVIEELNKKDFEVHFDTETSVITISWIKWSEIDE